MSNTKTERLKNILVNAKKTDKEFIIIHLKGDLKIRYTTEWEDTISNHTIMTSKTYDVLYIYNILLKNLHKLKRLQLYSVIPYYRKSEILSSEVEVYSDITNSKKASASNKVINNVIADKIKIYEKKINLYKELGIASYQQINNYDYKTLNKFNIALFNKPLKIQDEHINERKVA